MFVHQPSCKLVWTQSFQFLGANTYLTSFAVLTYVVSCFETGNCSWYGAKISRFTNSYCRMALAEWGKTMFISKLSAWLGMRQGEISKGVKRLIRAGLDVDRDAQRYPQVSALQEWLSYGVRYAYPVKCSGFGRGMPTYSIGDACSHSINCLGHA